MCRSAISRRHSSPRRRLVRDEESLHKACVELLAWLSSRHPILQWMLHVPNGGKRPKGEAGRLKAMGVRPGVPDLLLPIPSGNWSGLAVELKSPTGRLSPAQAAWLDRLEQAGYLVAVCRSIDQFKAVVDRFLSGRKPPFGATGRVDAGFPVSTLRCAPHSPSPAP